MTTNRQRSLTSDLYKSNCTLSELKTSILWERPIKNEKTEKKKKPFAVQSEKDLYPEYILKK